MQAEYCSSGGGAGVSYTQCAPVEAGDRVNWDGWVNLESGCGGLPGALALCNGGQLTGRYRQKSADHGGVKLCSGTSVNRVKREIK